MACCLIAPSHYLNQYWLLINEILWLSPMNNFTVGDPAIMLYNEFELILSKLLPYLSVANKLIIILGKPLQWRHNECNGISNHWRLDCLPSHLFRYILKKSSKPCVAALCERNPLVTSEFPSQRASNMANVYIWCRNHAKCSGDVRDLVIISHGIKWSSSAMILTKYSIIRKNNKINKNTNRKFEWLSSMGKYFYHLHCLGAEKWDQIQIAIYISQGKYSARLVLNPKVAFKNSIFQLWSEVTPSSRSGGA